MGDYNIDIGRRIYEKRLEKKLTREQVIDCVNISEVYLGMIERGKRGTSIEHMVQIADLLGMSMDYMILGKEREFDTTSSLAKELDGLEKPERKFLEKVMQRLRINKISENHLKAISDIVDYYVAYEAALVKE